MPRNEKGKYDSVTLNKLSNINITGDFNKNVKPQDLSKYEAICFDEVKMYGPIYLNKIYNFMNHTNKKYLQLETLINFNHSFFI